MERVLRLGLLAIVSLLCASRVAGAQEPPAPPAFAPEAAGAGPHRSAECKGHRATFAVAVHELRTTTFYFASPVLEALSSSRDLIVRPGHMTVTVQPRNTKQAEFGNLRITTMTCEAQIEVRRAERLADAPLRVDVTQVDELALRRRELDEKEQALDEEKRKLDEEKQQLKREAEEAMDAMAMNLLLNNRPLRPILDETRREGDLMSLSLGNGYWLDGNTYYFPIKLQYRGPQPFLMERIEVVDAAGAFLDAKIIGMRSPTTREGIITEIQPGQVATGVIKLSRAAQGSIAPLTIRLIEATGMSAIMVVAQDWEISGPWRPISPEEAESRERERLEQERERQAKGRVSVHLLSMLGGSWLQDGQVLPRTDATLTRGLGARITYSFNRYLAFEAEALGVGTGEARFADTIWNGMQGELMRTAALGRLLGGAVVRFGDEVLIPLGRIGVGFQGGSLGSRFLVAGNEVMPGPESVAALDVCWYFGGGVDVRLGPVEAGLRLSGVTSLKSATSEPAGSLSIEAVLHIGYSWKP